MYRIEFKKTFFDIPAVCVICGNRFKHEGIESILMGNDEKIGVVCEGCLEAGINGISFRLRIRASALTEEAEFLAKLSKQNIECSMEEYQLLYKEIVFEKYFQFMEKDTDDEDNSTH